MSSFNSGYKNAQNEENQDNSYFTFLTAILLLVVIHYIILIYKRIFYKVPYDDENKYINCHCSKCKERYNYYKLKIRAKNINKKLYFYIFLFLISLFLLIACCIKVKNSNNKRFDPFEILEISESASLSEIKKSYKKLSLKYHPDKNPNDKIAKEKFININKAYRALTNEKAKENYKKYGNPDGPGLLSYGFALPFFLFQGKVGSYILIIFSISMTIIFPIIFIRWFKNSKRYNNSGLLLENLPFYYDILDKDILITQLPFVIGMSKEFNEMDIKYDEIEIKKLYNFFKPYFPKNASKYENITFKNMMAISIIYVHFSGSTVIINDEKFNEEFNLNKNKIIEKSLFLIDQLIKTAFELNRIFEFNKGIEEFQKNEDNKNKIKKINLYEIKEIDLNLIKIILAFRARLFHETNIKSKNDELLQFPENKDNLPIFEKNNYISIIETIYNISKSKNELKYLNNYKDIEEVIKIMPKYKLKVDISNTRYEVENLLTFNINIVRGDENKINSDEQKELGYLHSNNYFDNYNEEIIVIIFNLNKKSINYYEKCKFEFYNEEKKIDFRMLVENEGKNNFEVYLYSLSYPGIIIKKEVKIEISEENNLMKNFIKNRYSEILSQGEFEENYGVFNDAENEEDEIKNEEDDIKNEDIHEHQN